MNTVQLRNTIAGWRLMPCGASSVPIINKLYGTDDYTKLKNSELCFERGRPVAEVLAHAKDVCKQLGLSVSVCGKRCAPTLRVWEKPAKPEASAEVVRYAQEVVAAIYETTVDREDLVSKRVFKYTECGAWCKFNELGVMVGTIVEGSDAEHHEQISLRGIRKGMHKEISKRFFAAIQRCEGFSSEVWAEMEAIQ